VWVWCGGFGVVFLWMCEQQQGWGGGGECKHTNKQGIDVLLWLLLLFCGCSLWLFCGVLQVPESFHGRSPSV